MKLHTITGHHLVAAYVRLYPAEIAPDQIPAFFRIFDAWLAKIREKKYRQQISLGNNYTAKKTFALLWLLQGDIEPPASLNELTALLDAQHDWQSAMNDRLKRLRE